MKEGSPTRGAGDPVLPHLVTWEGGVRPQAEAFPSQQASSPAPHGPSARPPSGRVVGLSVCLLSPQEGFCDLGSRLQKMDSPCCVSRSAEELHLRQSVLLWLVLGGR